ncbi:PP2C family protein-serine/threonine phosphatase [Aestuariibius insulae]|uniref:PP2C family protein-serine/threonine phosphatase n=1 Tax=Aestuariibius insulae TaxID=2058287 RepID=UPI00345E3DCC
MTRVPTIAQAKSHLSVDPPDLIVVAQTVADGSALSLCEDVMEMDLDYIPRILLLADPDTMMSADTAIHAGADDLLFRPLDLAAFETRLIALDRIAAEMRGLTARKRMAETSLGQLRDRYEVLERDLVEAKHLQQSLLPPATRDYGSARFSIMLQSAHSLGGDLVSYFPVGKTKVGFFAFDVSGHGIPSALMASRIAGLMSHQSLRRNIAIAFDTDGTARPRNPAELAYHLNEAILNDIRTDQYFTLIVGHCDLETGRVNFVQAGHPHPVIQRADGAIELAGDGGYPIGLIADAVYEESEVTLHPGDRLLLLSDGVTDCIDPDGNMLLEAGLIELMRENRALKGPAFLDAMIWTLNGFASDQDFPDDISALLIDFSGGTPISPEP